MSGTERAEDDADLACYALRPDDDHALPASVAMVDHFGAITVRPRGSRQLCLRSTVAPAP